MANHELLLNFAEKVDYQDQIESYNVIAHLPFINNFDYNSEIRILINQADNLTDTGASWLRIEGKIVKGTAAAAPSLISNGVLHLFESATYKINQTEIDFVKTPGLTTALKNLVSKSKDYLSVLENAGFSDPNGSTKDKAPTAIFEDGDNQTFTVIIKFRDLFGVGEHLTSLLVNTTQEIILTRGSSDLNTLVGANDNKNSSVDINRISWHVPMIKLNDQARSRLYKTLLKNPTFYIPFRTWQLLENPNIGTALDVNWNLKVTSSASKPRYVIVAFYEDQKNKIDKNLSLPIKAPLKSARVYLNDEIFPYYDWSSKNSAELFNAYSDFHSTYYGGNTLPMMTRETLNDHTICVIDCSRQKEMLKHGSSVDIRLALKFSSPLKANTSCSVLLLCEAICSYMPVGGTASRS